MRKYCVAVLMSAVSVSFAGTMCPAAEGGVSSQANEQPVVERYLETGQLAEGAKAVTDRLREHPDDQQARFSLGVVQFLQAVERLAQTEHRYGLMQHHQNEIPFLRLPVPPNPDPQEIDYAAARQIIEQFVKDVQKAETTLAEVKPDGVKLPLHFGRIRLDLDGDGKATDEETLWRIYARFNRRVNQDNGEQFLIAFDGGDVHWLRGYCHLLMALGDASLAYDWRDQFERTAHLFYPRVKTPYPFLLEGAQESGRGFNFPEIADAIAFVHLLNFEVKEPQRLSEAREHLLAMVSHSRASWKLIQAETDDDHEWIPNPRQSTVIPGVRVTEEMIEGWHQFLAEAEDVLEGRKLVPFWRGTQKRGVNLRRVFEEPRNFDLVLWVQGTAAAPYLEEGDMTDQEVWTRLIRVFGGEFVGFALWFN